MTEVILAIMLMFADGHTEYTRTPVADWDDCYHKAQTEIIQRQADPNIVSMSVECEATEVK